MTILEAIRKHAEDMPEKVAIIEDNKEISYGYLWDKVARAATFYGSIGKKGDRIILAANKSVDFVYSYFGAQLAGLITVTVDSAVNSKRLNRIVESSKQIGIFGKLDQVHDGILCREFPDLSEINVPTTEFDMPAFDDFADILYTTGTTGNPKGVVLSHHNEQCAAQMINTFIGNSCDDIELLALPISHSFGLGRLRCTMLKGGTIDLLGSFASMKKFYREIETREITGFGMVPASWNYIKKMSLDKIGRYADQLKYIEIGSAPMPMDDKRLLMKLLPNTRICMHYGLTEASRSAFICFHESSDCLDSIGKPSPGVDILIMDEKGNELGVGQEGEICVKGEHVCCSYWGEDEEKYPDSFHGAYFRTGDWGFVDSEGYFRLISRKKELINVGGKKVSPIEVEEIIGELEGVDDSACIGVPDSVMGEVVKAFVVRRSELITQERIISYVKERLEAYKVPVAVEFIDAIPKTSSGKVQRLLLK